MEEEEKKYERCDLCGKLSEEVKYTINPYYKEMDNAYVWQYLCPSCYNNSVDDI